MKDCYFIPDPETNLPMAAAWLTYMPPYGIRGRGRNIEDNTWMLNRITVMRGYDKGTGLGTKLLELVCAAADAEQVTLVLGVSPETHGYFRRLVRWYRRHGFKPFHRTVGHVHNMMIRTPHADA